MICKLCLNKSFQKPEKNNKLKKKNPKSRSTPNSKEVQDEMFKNNGLFPLSEWWRLFQSFYICQNTFNCSLKIYELHFM